jgi:hypothetical protein
MRYLILLAYFLGAQVLAMADTAVLPPDVASFLANEQNGVSDEGTIESGSNSSGEFVRYVRGNWRYILANLSAIAPDLRRQCLIMAAAESLPPSDYLDFLNTLCDSVASDKTSQFEVDSIQDGDAQKEGFLAYNYDNPRVALVIRKIQGLEIAKRPNDADTRKYFAEMESGELKENAVQEWRDGDGDLPERYPASVAERFAFAFAPFVLSAILPFIRTLRGRRLVSSFFICWGLLVLWNFLFAFGVPVIGDTVGRHLDERLFDWAPEWSAVVKMAYFGWFYAGITVLLSLLVRLVVRWWSKETTEHCLKA